MAVLKIIKYSNPLLRRACRPIDAVTPDEKRLLDDMLETMYIDQGVGLAASQVGISKRAIVLDVGDGPIQLINPIITKREGAETAQEGCLSLPELLVNVKRAKRVSYRALNKDGNALEGDADGLFARALQHEIDHLDGKLIIDYVNPIKRAFLKKKLIKKYNALNA